MTSRPLKLALVTRRYPPLIGGAEKVLSYLAGALASAGADVTVVTSQFPIAGEPTRGRPILQTVRELAKLATVRVLSPVATYPRWAQPKSYLFRAPEKESPVAGIDAEYVSYPALPAI